MKILRIFISDSYKGTKNYLSSQKKYEVIRTLIYFGISISLFAAGYITTKTRLNLLTVVAILGCLPASKSAVKMIMHLRYRSLSSSACETIEAQSEGLTVLYDMVFTAYERNYAVGHLAMRGNTLIGFTEDPKFQDKAFYTHIEQIFKKEVITGISVKIFSDLKKYTNRLSELKELSVDDSLEETVISTLKSVSL